MISYNRCYKSHLGRFLIFQPLIGLKRSLFHIRTLSNICSKQKNLLLRRRGHCCVFFSCKHPNIARTKINLISISHGLLEAACSLCTPCPPSCHRVVALLTVLPIMTLMLRKAFMEIYESNYSFLDDSIVRDMLQRFVNCFSKGYANMQSEQIKIDKNNRKKRKTLQYR